MTMTGTQSDVVFTVGHSTRELSELINILKASQIELLIDVRTIPKSRRNPQFNIDSLQHELPLAGISYKHMIDLGGLRQARADSLNTVWENGSFRGYADYMETQKFHEAADELVEIAQQQRVAIMCAEALWWRCHRSMISDELVARGLTVEHLGSGPEPQCHALKLFARIRHHHVSYHQGS